MEYTPIPRMRTAAKVVAEIKELDPGSEVTEHYIRKLVREQAVRVVWAGNKALINLDDVLALLCMGTQRPEAEACIAEGSIRPLSARLRG